MQLQSQPIVFLLATLAVLLSTAPDARGDTLTPNDVLRISFTTNPETFDLFEPAVPDLLFWARDFPSTASNVSGYDAWLYDGDELLGTSSFSGVIAPIAFVLFTSDTSLWTSRDPTIVDFTSILAGSIDGRIDFRIQSGTLTFAGITSPILGVGSGPSSLFARTQWATYTYEIIPARQVPEPGSLWLLGTAGLVVGLRLRRRDRLP